MRSLSIRRHRSLDPPLPVLLGWSNWRKKTLTSQSLVVGVVVAVDEDVLPRFVIFFFLSCMLMRTFRSLHVVSEYLWYHCLYFYAYATVQFLNYLRSVL